MEARETEERPNPTRKSRALPLSSVFLSISVRPYPSFRILRDRTQSTANPQKIAQAKRKDLSECFGRLDRVLVEGETGRCLRGGHNVSFLMGILCFSALDGQRNLGILPCNCTWYILHPKEKILCFPHALGRNLCILPCLATVHIHPKGKVPLDFGNTGGEESRQSSTHLKAKVLCFPARIGSNLRHPSMFTTLHTHPKAKSLWVWPDTDGEESRYPPYREHHPALAIIWP